MRLNLLRLPMNKEAKMLESAHVQDEKKESLWRKNMGNKLGGKVPTKADFNKVFNELKKWGYTVLNFSDKRALRRGMKDWVDYVIFNNHSLTVIELKIGADKLSEGQKRTNEKLSSIADSGLINYAVIRTIEQAKSMVDKYLEGAKWTEKF